MIQWMKSMKNTGTFIDHYWLLACAQMLGRDIVLIPSFTQSSTEIGRIIRIQGGVNEDFGVFPPIFLGYLEDNMYTSGHFQAIVPTDESVPIVQYLIHGNMPQATSQSILPSSFNFTRMVPLTNMPSSLVDRVSYNCSSIFTEQSRHRIQSEIS